MIVCPLCESTNTRLFFVDDRTHTQYHHCATCDLRFMDAKNHLTAQDELLRYQLHKNDLEATDYQEFVAPLVHLICQNVAPGAHGLDYGCGPAPIMTHTLSKHGFKMSQFDPFFKQDYEALNSTYDFIVASEVVEHFYRPRDEFFTLKKRLRKNGVLGIMTSLVQPETDFGLWHYRRDPTHVSFYSEKCFVWIKNEFQFTDLHITGRRTLLLT